MRRPTHLRPFHHRGDADSELPLLRLSSDPDEYSSSEQSCDTVIYVGPNGAAVSDRELTDNEGPPEFVPIVPALLRGKLPEQHQIHGQCQTAGAQNKTNSPVAQPNSTPRSHWLVNRWPLSQRKELNVSNATPLLSCRRDWTALMAVRSRENLNVVGHIEGKGRPLGSPRLGIASLTKTSDYRPPSSPSQRCKVYTQKGVTPATPPLSSHTLAQDGQATDALTSDSN
ncbi:hypothetical protein GOODEAATRI_006473 [Goodea atripinnis]|uniref:Uncharacterized protein n=1 Tax=Goodea atripinnis TaxID=208336 RepID=A0ABV0PW18_9TELE